MVISRNFNPLIRLFLGNRNIINKIFADYYYHQDMSLHDRFDYNVIDFKTSLKNLNLQKKHEK